MSDDLRALTGAYVLDALPDADRIAAVLAQPDARTVRGSLTGGGEVEMVASAKGDAAVVVLSVEPEGGSRQPTMQTATVLPLTA